MPATPPTSPGSLAWLFHGAAIAARCEAEARAAELDILAAAEPYVPGGAP